MKLNLDEEQAQSFNLITCCACRDAFNTQVGNNCIIGAYIQQQNPLLILESCILPRKVTDDDIRNCFSKSTGVEGEIFSHNHNIRMLRSLLNCEATNLILERKEKWVVIDTYNFLTQNLLILEYEGHQQLIQSTDYGKYCEKLIHAVDDFKDVKLHWYDAIINPHLYLDSFCDYLKKYWDKKIIIVDTTPCTLVKKDDRLVSLEEPFFGAIQSLHISRLLQKRLHAKIIQIPQPAISRDGFSVHYVSEILEYIKQSIDSIVNNEKELIGDIYGDCLLKIYELRMIPELTKYAIKNEINKLYYAEDENCWKRSFELSVQLMNGGDKEASYFLARAYHDGRGIDKNMHLAVNYYKKAFVDGISWVLSEYKQALYELDEKIEYLDLFKVISTSSEETFCLSTIIEFCIKEKIVLSKDELIDKFKILINKKISVSGELISILRDSDFFNKSHIMHDIIVNCPCEDALSYYIYGKIYQDGDYVIKDLKKAYYFVSVAVEMGIAWANNDLFDICLQIESKHEELYKIISRLNPDDPSTSFRMAQCYYWGYGINKNLLSAMHYCNNAYEKGLKWAKYFLFDICWEINDPVLDKQMMHIITTDYDEGDVEQQKRISLAKENHRGM